MGEHYPLICLPFIKKSLEVSGWKRQSNMWELGRTARSPSGTFSPIGPFIGSDPDMVSAFEKCLLPMVPVTDRTGL